MVQGTLASEPYFTPPLCCGLAERLSRGHREEMGTATSPRGPAIPRGWQLAVAPLGAAFFGAFCPGGRGAQPGCRARRLGPGPAGWDGYL